MNGSLAEPLKVGQPTYSLAKLDQIRVLPNYRLEPIVRQGCRQYREKVAEH